MADNVAITAGSGTTIATDDCGAGGHAQVIKLAISTNGDITYIPADATLGLAVSNRTPNVRVAVASAGLTTATTAYSVGDQAGTIFTIAGAARVSGGFGIIQSINLIDEGDVGTDYRIHFYRASVTLAADNAAFAVSDTDQRSCVGYVQMPSMIDVGANRITTLGNVGIGYDCSGGTSLFAAIETRTANAVYAAVSNLYLSVALILL